MKFTRRAFVVGALLAVAAALSGCVIRPLWWDHDHHEHAEFRSY